MPERRDHAGIAALSLCEAMLLALRDNAVLPEREIEGILRDAADTHANAAKPDADQQMHRAVAQLINGILGKFVPLQGR
ncbi:hypothetical protein [Pseudooceanicola spongiae]|uniref:Uncharacterized protein n=1 Tax=Pseudooceanicola spongiae TaxID=2613965 RepID=A0A7L9WMS9_9RHOB|nr:hypothetical protein [Pseudooceanicola spongiae]QOL81134.1 hypothetical protein F3W81_10120 [Pseudooceanicola spongiae]